MHNSSPAVEPTDTLVIGGGIIGLSIAWVLTGRGQTVTLLEAKRCGTEASWAGVGILPPVATRNTEEPLEQLRALSHGLLAKWSCFLEQQTGIDVGYRKCGGVYLATTSGEAALLQASRDWWEELGIEAHAWSANELAEHEPALAQAANSGRLKTIWSLPDECQVRTPRYVQALVAACRARGVQIVEHCTVDNVTQGDGQVVVTASIGPNAEATQSFTAQQCCLTSGAWTGQLLERLQITSGILPIRGQVILYQPTQQLLSRIINEGHRYLVPRPDGRILVGSNEEETGFVCETTSDVLLELHQWASGMLPALENVPIEKSWAGLRPGSFDSYPYIGRLPNQPNIYVAAGHYRAGIHLSAGTAQVLADLITTGHSTIDLKPFRPGRG